MAPPVRAIGRAAVPAGLSTPPPSRPEVVAIAMGRPTAQLPRVTPIVGRAPVAPAPRPPAEISHPATVYRAVPGGAPIPDTLLDDAGEDSGSLTGHVLSRGQPDRPAPRSRTVVTVLLIAAVVVVLALFGLAVAAATSDAVSGLFDRMFGG